MVRCNCLTNFNPDQGCIFFRILFLMIGGKNGKIRHQKTTFLFFLILFTQNINWFTPKNHLFSPIPRIKPPFFLRSAQTYIISVEEMIFRIKYGFLWSLFSARICKIILPFIISEDWCGLRRRWSWWFLRLVSCGIGDSYAWLARGESRESLRTWERVLAIHRTPRVSSLELKIINV